MECVTHSQLNFHVYVCFDVAPDVIIKWELYGYSRAAIRFCYIYLWIRTAAVRRPSVKTSDYVTDYDFRMTGLHGSRMQVHVHTSCIGG